MCAQCHSALFILQRLGFSKSTDYKHTPKKLDPLIQVIFMEFLEDSNPYECSLGLLFDLMKEFHKIFFSKMDHLH
jgi:hypothetical protein